MSKTCIHWTCKANFSPTLRRFSLLQSQLHVYNSYTWAVITVTSGRPMRARLSNVSRRNTCRRSWLAESCSSWVNCSCRCCFLKRLNIGLRICWRSQVGPNLPHAIWLTRLPHLRLLTRTVLLTEVYVSWNVVCFLQPGAAKKTRKKSIRDLACCCPEIDRGFRIFSPHRVLSFPLYPLMRTSTSRLSSE